MNESQTLLRKQYESLPGSLKQVLIQANLRNQLISIMQRKKLRVDQAGFLENEVVMVLLGLEHPSHFIDNLEKHAGLSEEEAKSVAGDVNEQIFAPLRAALRMVHESQKPQHQGMPQTEVKQPKPPPPQSTPTTPQKTTEPDLRGLERTMPRDVALAKKRAESGVPEQKQPSTNEKLANQRNLQEEERYIGNDPYREPIE